MRTRSQSVTEELRKMIVQGQIPAETHLQEEACAEMLHVSRTPVRAALGILASEGYLDYRPKRGYVVLEFKREDVRDAWQLRAWLAGLAAMLAAERGVDRAAEQVLRDAIATGDRILAKGRFDAEDHLPYRDMNSTLHSTIIASAGNARLQLAIRQTMNIPMISDQIVPWENYEVTKRSHDDHHPVVEAIMSRESWRTEALMREHIWFGSKRVSGYPLKSGNA